MSVNSVSNPLVAFYGPLTAGNATPARSAASDKNTAASTVARADVTQSPNSAPYPAVRAATAASESGDQADHLESALERALRANRVTTGKSTDQSSSSTSGRSGPGVALYQRVSQYANNEDSVSALWKNWSDIVQEGRFQDSAVAGYVKTLAQNDTLGLQSGIIHLTV